jgi:hypothetical protein
VSANYVHSASIDNYSVRLCLFIRRLASEHIPLNRLIEVAENIKHAAEWDNGGTKDDLTETERKLSSFLGFDDKEMQIVLERANAELFEENKKLRDEVARIRGLFEAERELVHVYRNYSAKISTHNQQMAEQLSVEPSEYKMFRLTEEPTSPGTIDQSPLPATTLPWRPTP